MKKLRMFFSLTLFAGFVAFVSQELIVAEDAPPPAAPAAAEAPAEAAPAEPSAAPAPAEAPAVPSPEEMTKIRDAAKAAVEDEIKVFGSFEIDHPETDELLKLTLSGVQDELRADADGTYVVNGNFKDEKGAEYGVDLYVEQLEEGEYELVDAILVSAAGKPVAQEPVE